MISKGSAVKKVPGGKMVRVEVTYGDRIVAAKIMGDFFLHPEDTLGDIELTFKGSPLPLQVEALTQQIERVIQNRQADLIGVSAMDIVQTIAEAVQ